MTLTKESEKNFRVNSMSKVNVMMEQSPSIKTEIESIKGMEVKPKFMKNRNNFYFTVAFAAIVMVMAVSCEKDINVTSVTLDNSKLNLIEGGTSTLTATVSPDNATNKSVTWKSSNPKVATVSNGTVKAITLGETTITVTTEDGKKTASCTIKVVDPKDPYSPVQGDVYIAGCIENVATIWKNGVAQELTEGADWSTAYSVYVSDGNVYVAGVENNVAKLWINGVDQHIPVGSFGSSANSVYVSGKDVYVAGCSKERIGDQYSAVFQIVKLWKNGVAQNVSDVNKDAYAHSIYVSGNDVYIVGYEGYSTNSKVAMLWKNGVAQSLSEQSNNEAYSVYVSGNDVYVAGCVNRVAKLWKNGVAQDLTDGSKYGVAYSVFVSGSDVYVAGFDGDIAMIWKNGVAQNLPSYFSTKAHSVYVSGDDVYAAGWNSFDVKLWKNGESQPLPNGDGEAYSVFVVK